MEPPSGRGNYTTKMGTMLSSPTYTNRDTEQRFSFHRKIKNKDGSLFTRFCLIIWLAHPHLPPKFTFKAAVQANPIKPVKRVGLVKPIPPRPDHNRPINAPMNDLSSPHSDWKSMVVIQRYQLKDSWAKICEAIQSTLITLHN